MRPEIVTWANLFSVLRIVVLPGVAYGLSRDDRLGVLLCIILFAFAAITDFLDGYLARRLNQISRLGIALDPIADKIFAGVTIIFLVIYREMPIWLAIVVVGRDLLILSAAALLLRGRQISLPSNLVGKYTFGVIAFLLGSYVIRFPFGITMTTIATLVMIAWSIASYARVFVDIRKGKLAAEQEDRKWLLWTLRVGSAAAIVVYAVAFYFEYLN